MNDKRNLSAIKRFDAIAEALTKAQTEITARLEETELAFGSEVGKIQVIEEYPPAPQAMLSSSTELLESWFKKCEQIRVRNEPILAANRELVKRIEAYMRSIGFAESEKVQRASGRKTVEEWETPGWRVSVIRQIKITDGFRYAASHYEFEKNRIAKFVEEARRKSEAEESKKKAEAKQTEDRLLVAVMATKYGLPHTADSRKVMDAILGESKYLHLAHYLQKNRGNWSEGCSYAEFGIDRFNIETTEDEEIYTDIMRHIENWDGDGRVFRDTKWSYDTLFSKVDSELFSDYQKILEVRGDDW